MRYFIRLGCQRRMIRLQISSRNIGIIFRGTEIIFGPEFDNFPLFLFIILMVCAFEINIGIGDGGKAALAPIFVALFFLLLFNLFSIEGIFVAGLEVEIGSQLPDF